MRAHSALDKADGVESRQIPFDGPLDLRATLAPLHGRFASDGWWLGARTPQGPGSMRVKRTVTHVVGEGWGAGSSWLLERLGKICGLEDHPESFETDHPVVAPLHRQNQGRRFGKTDLVFDSLLVAIAGQKVTGTEAAAAMRGLTMAFSEAAPGPNPSLRLPPDPERIAAAPYWEFHRLHLEKRRADVLRRVAAGHIRINELASASVAQAEVALSSHRGIGPWSVAKTLAVSHGDPDQVEVGDFHVKHMVVYHLTGRPRGTDEEMLELLEEFRPHRGRVSRLLNTLGHEPAFGPRSKPRNITQI